MTEQKQEIVGVVEEGLSSLLDKLQLDTLRSEDELNLAFKELCKGAKTTKEKKEFVDTYNKIKKIIRTKPRSNKGLSTITIIEPCKKCHKVHINNYLRVPSGAQQYTCPRCAGTKRVLKKLGGPCYVECPRCKGKGKILIKCFQCRGAGKVELKRTIKLT